MNIEQFLNEFFDIICDEHKEEIEQHWEFLKTFINVDKVNSKYGEHYVSCPWSKNDATEGPDTCDCYYVDMHLKRVLYLINFYKNLKKRGCLSCCGNCLL